jgi:hypothetical protein
VRGRWNVRRRKAYRVLEQTPLDRDHLEDMRRWENSKMFLKEKGIKEGWTAFI